MFGKRVRAVGPFVLVACVIAVAVFFAMQGPPARSEENDGGEGADQGEYGIPPGEINERGPAQPIFTKQKPLVPLKDLPPMPPLFGFGGNKMARERYQKALEAWEARFSPEEREELERKIEQLKNRKFPWEKEEEEEN